MKEWVEMWSWELQTKEKEKEADKGQVVGTASGRDAVELREEQQETMGEVTEAGGTEVEEIAEVEVSLVRKRRRLMIAGDMRPAEEKVSAEEAMSARDNAKQGEVGRDDKKGAAAPWAS